MLVSVIIPNWNGFEFLKKCLPSIERQTLKNFEVIVVDNGSKDGSVEYIERKFPQTRLVALKKNTGFAFAVNLGVKISMGKYVVLLNNDTKVEPKCFEFLVRAAKSKSDVGMVAAKMLSMNNPKIIDSAGDYIDIVGHANNFGLGERDGPKYNIEGYIFLVTGGGCLIKREVFEKIGFFDEKYFAYFEDVDFCLRAQMQGIKAWYEPKAVIYHIHKATSSKFRAFLEYLQFRNMTMTIIRDFPNKLLFNNLAILKILLVNIHTVYYLATKGFLISALRAEAYILLNLFDLLRERKKIQSTIKVSDDYLIENFRPKVLKFPFGFKI